MLATLGSIKKAIVSAIGVTLAVLVFANDHLGGFIPAHYQVILGTLIAILTPVATWAVKNDG